MKNIGRLVLLQSWKKSRVLPYQFYMGELQKVLKVGFKPNKIVFSGVGKTSSELDFAIKKKILLINVESESELKNIINLSKNKNSTVNVGIRLNPNVNAQTIGKISTGRNEFISGYFG